MNDNDDKTTTPKIPLEFFLQSEGEEFRTLMEEDYKTMAQSFHKEIRFHIHWPENSIKKYMNHKYGTETTQMYYSEIAKISMARFYDVCHGFTKELEQAIKEGKTNF